MRACSLRIVPAILFLTPRVELEPRALGVLGRCSVTEPHAFLQLLYLEFKRQLLQGALRLLNFQGEVSVSCSITGNDFPSLKHVTWD